MNLDYSSSMSESLRRVKSLEKRFEIVQTIVLSLAVAGLTGLLAQIRIPLPLTPVPITGQVFGVLLAGLLFGRRVGGFSQFLYLSGGVAGVPWFTGMSAGLGVLVGPTGGFLVGFVLAGFAVGWIKDLILDDGQFGSVWLSAGFGLLIIYLFGSLHLGILFQLGPREVLVAAVVPFLWIDLMKISLLAGVYHLFSDH